LWSTIRVLLHKIGVVSHRVLPPPAKRVERGPIRAFDEYGREVQIDRDTWLTQVLPHKLEAAWNDAEQLSSSIFFALSDGFAEAVIPAARRFATLRSHSPEGPNLHAVVLLEAGRPNEAASVLKRAIKRFSADANLFANLGGAEIAMGMPKQAESSLRRALAIDPNNKSALNQLFFMIGEKDTPGHYDLCREFAKAPGSWRPQVWLAHEALEKNDVRHALTLYEVACSNAASDLPSELLGMMAGDLLDHGQPKEAIILCTPLYQVTTHDIEIGAVLIRAYLETHRMDEARALLDQLHALRRPDWQAPLAELEDRLVQNQIEREPPGQDADFGWASIDGPVWLPEPHQSVLCANKPADEQLVLVIGPSCSQQNHGDQAARTLATPQGRFSRGLAALMLDHVFFGTKAACQLNIPWVVHPNGSSFGVCTSTMSDHDAVAFAQSHPKKPAYVIVTHISGDEKHWAVETRLVDVGRGIRAAEFHREFSPASADPTPVLSLLHDLRFALVDQCGVSWAAFPEFFDPPTNARFVDYAIALEQLLLVRCVASEPPERMAGFSNRRGTMNTVLAAVLNDPASATLHAILAQTCRYMQSIELAVLSDSRPGILKLLRERSIPSSIQGVARLAYSAAFPGDTEIMDVVARPSTRAD
jgi:Flp pilus assembly protein TadD